MPERFEFSPIGYVRSPLKDRSSAPRQGSEGAPDVDLEIDSQFADCLEGIESGQDIWIFTWLHEARRSVHKVHPRGDTSNPLLGVFATRSPDRPNPVGLHLATVLSIDGLRLRVQAVEAIDGTPLIDIKPALECSRPR